jgi:hypothetical protein
MYISVLAVQRLPEEHQERYVDNIIMYEDSGGDILDPYRSVDPCRINFTIPSTTDSFTD